MRTIPGEGLIVKNGKDSNLDDVIAMGCWSQLAEFFPQEKSQGWSIAGASQDGRHFEVLCEGKTAGLVNWDLHGSHNRMNALAAIAAAQHAGVPVDVSCEALAEFQGIKRRLEIRGEVNGVTVYDDFAHHPTAIVETLKAMNEIRGEGRVFAVLEPRSNTMRMGVHRGRLCESLQQADEICLYQNEGTDWSLEEEMKASARPATIFDDTQAIIDHLVENTSQGDHVLIMSNGGFEGIHGRLLVALEAQ